MCCAECIASWKELDSKAIFFLLSLPVSLMNRKEERLRVAMGYVGLWNATVAQCSTGMEAFATCKGSLWSLSGDLYQVPFTRMTSTTM